MRSLMTRYKVEVDHVEAEVGGKWIDCQVSARASSTMNVTVGRLGLLGVVRLAEVAGFQVHSTLIDTSF